MWLIWGPPYGYQFKAYFVLLAAHIRCDVSFPIKKDFCYITTEKVYQAEVCFTLYYGESHLGSI